MNTSRDGPEHREALLSAALRAHAGGTAPPGAAPAERPGTQLRGRLPVLRVLLFALVLGLVAGAVAGGLSVL